jgi:DNA repair protein RadC
MVTTEYAVLSTEELLQFTIMTGHRTPLEIELAQRLEQAVDMLKGVFTPERIGYVERLA